MFSRRLKAGEGPQLFYGSKRIPKSQTVKYLGVLMDKQLTWASHIKFQIEKSTGIHAALFPLLKSNSPLALKTKLLLYNSSIKPLLSYAAPAWLHASATHLKKIQTCENKIIRKIIGAPWFISNKQIRKDLKLVPILEFLKTALTKFQYSLLKTDNKLLKNLWDYVIPPKPSHKTPKCALIPSHIPLPT